jgi:cytoplasmic iron level regulating protein YaaA (DUF328/UPF0246 family)
MLFLLSPAKSLDYDRPLPRGVRQRATEPLFLPQASALIDTLKPLPAQQVATLMDLSDDLAQLNAARYAAWVPQHDDRNSRPAVLAFNGDVYDGLDVRSLQAADLAWAQDHVVILSGLYGALRPLDRLQPYRLEMGTRHANPAGKDLYAFWGDTVASYLNQRLAGDKHPVVINLASQEYFKVARRPALGARVVDCVFEDWKDDGRGGGQYKIISFFAKRARGAMARWAILHRARSVKALQGFDTDGYAFDAAASSADSLVFRRRQAADAPA